MKDLKVGGKQYSLPETVSEVPAERWRDVALGLVGNNRVLTFCALAGLPVKTGVQISPEQWVALLPEIDWLHRATSEKAPMPFIQLWGTKYFLPADGMEFSPIVEFVMAEDAIWRFLREDDQSALAELFFTLCRPENTQPRDGHWSGDNRERYNAALVQQRVRTTPVPNWAAYLLLLFFAGVKNALRERYPEIFSGAAPEPDEDGQPVASQESPAVGWLKLLKALAEKNLYGSYEDVCYTFMHTVMLNLSFDMDAAQSTTRNPLPANDLE